MFGSSQPNTIALSNCLYPVPCRFLSLVCLLREDVFEKQGLIEYNFHCFREAIQDVSFLLLYTHPRTHKVTYSTLSHMLTHTHTGV